MPQYKVLLIDDEPIITEGLQILIDWEALDLEIVGSASDGLQGLKLISELQPDIVISDICMPNCTGIDMISQARQCCMCQFIILSGYSDFSYAKQCMSFGVQEYLLKPIDEAELIQALENVKKQIQLQKQSHEALSQLDNVSQQLSSLTSDDMLRDLTSSYFESDEDFHIALANYGFDLHPGQAYLAVAFQYENCRNNYSIRSDLNIVLETLSVPFLLFYQGNNIFIGIFSIPKECSIPAFTARFTALHTLLSETSNREFCIGISNPCTNVYQISFACKQAVCALSCKIIRGFHSVNPFDSTLKNAHFIQTIPNALLDAYRQSLLQPNFASITNAIQKIFQYMTDFTDMPLFGIQINTLNLIMTCIQYLSDIPSAPADAYENTDFLQQISSIQTAEELEKYAGNIIYSLINKGRDERLAKPSELITKVENYITSNYFEDLSLINVAQMFYISPIYLSQTFKKQTGQLYLDFVTQVKMNAAKKLLLTTDLMVYEIAERLNYKDTKYFSKLFEKKTRQKPSEFRKNPHS